MNFIGQIDRQIRYAPAAIGKQQSHEYHAFDKFVLFGAVLIYRPQVAISSWSLIVPRKNCSCHFVPSY